MKFKDEFAEPKEFACHLRNGTMKARGAFSSQCEADYFEFLIELLKAENRRLHLEEANLTALRKHCENEKGSPFYQFCKDGGYACIVLLTAMTYADLTLSHPESRFPGIILYFVCFVPIFVRFYSRFKEEEKDLAAERAKREQVEKRKAEKEWEQKYLTRMVWNDDKKSFVKATKEAGEGHSRSVG